MRAIQSHVVGLNDSTYASSQLESSSSSSSSELKPQPGGHYPPGRKLHDKLSDLNWNPYTKKSITTQSQLVQDFFSSLEQTMDKFLKLFLTVSTKSSFLQLWQYFLKCCCV
jgi:hypothetical protein